MKDKVCKLLYYTFDCASVDIPIYVGWKAILTYWYMYEFKNKVILNFLFLFSWTGKIFPLGFNHNILKYFVPLFLLKIQNCLP